MNHLYGDGHVHLYPQFDLARLFASARAVSLRRGAPLVLLLAECERDRAFLRLRDSLRKDERGRLRALRLRHTTEAGSLALGDEGAGAGTVFAIAGRQLVSSEGIEVLALGLDPEHRLYEQGDRALPAATLLEHAFAAGAVGVLPWGVGKWVGERGRIVAELVASEPFRSAALGFVGDIAHRSWRWPRPAAFREPARVLAGTDLLPLPGLEERVAGFGFRLEGQLDPERPAAALLALLGRRAPLATVGQRSGLRAMLGEQLRLRLRPASPLGEKVA